MPVVCVCVCMCVPGMCVGALGCAGHLAAILRLLCSADNKRQDKRIGRFAGALSEPPPVAVALKGHLTLSEARQQRQLCPADPRIDDILNTTRAHNFPGKNAL